MKPYLLDAKNCSFSLEGNASEFTSLCRKYGLEKFKGRSYVNPGKIEPSEMTLLLASGYRKTYRLKYESGCFYPFIEVLSEIHFYEVGY